MMDALPYYKWLWRDWRSNRRVQRMPWQAKGIYRELLDEFWAEGSLPDDLSELADIAGCPYEVIAEYWVYISPCFEIRAGRLYNRKMDEQRTAKDAERVQKAESGRVGGLKSNSSTRATAEHDEASAKQVLGEAKHVQAQPDIAEQSRAIAEHTHKQEHTQSLAPTSQSESKPVGTIPCNGSPKQFAFYQHDVDEWEVAFPAVDVTQQLRQCRQWNIDNPKKRKTARGMRRFINAWLSRVQDAAGGSNGANRINGAEDRKRRGQQAIIEAFPDVFRGAADGSPYGLDSQLLPEPGSERGRNQVLEGRLD